MFRHRDHRAPQLLGRRHGTRKDRLKRRQNNVEDPIGLRLRLDPMPRLDKPRPKHVRRLERQRKQRIFCPALNSRPLRAPFSVLSVPARNIFKRHPRTDLHQSLRRCHRESVSHALVLILRHPRRRPPKAEEARIVTRQLRFNPEKNQKVTVNQLAQLLVLLPGRAPHDRQHPLNLRIEQTLPQNALPYHPRRAKYHSFHVQYHFRNQNYTPYISLLYTV
jgi:hypothetical protein